ncbi:MAG: hypothetical protein JO307_07755 [Bryobacterales bacterium]|nr:hypothetical protein [Bryobacterales bacterium]MBV9402048.1 hypothetical protein [Bryobacterales bacterium]
MKNFRSTVLQSAVAFGVLALALIIGFNTTSASFGPLPPPDDDGTFIAFGPLPPPDDDGTFLAFGPLPPPDDDGTFIAS